MALQNYPVLSPTHTAIMRLKLTSKEDDIALCLRSFLHGQTCNFSVRHNKQKHLLHGNAAFFY